MDENPRITKALGDYRSQWNAFWELKIRYHANGVGVRPPSSALKRPQNRGFTLFWGHVLTHVRHFDSIRGGVAGLDARGLDLAQA